MTWCYPDLTIEEAFERGRRMTGASGPIEAPDDPADGRYPTPDGQILTYETLCRIGIGAEPFKKHSKQKGS